MKCPGCNESLVRTRYAGANVRQCQKCQGLLLPQRRASTIERRVNKDLSGLISEALDGGRRDTLPEIRCPDCRDQMEKVLVEEAGIHVDRAS